MIERIKNGISQAEVARQKYVRRNTNTRYHERFTSKTVKHGGKSIMVWGAIKSDRSRTFVKCPARLNSVEYQIFD